MVDGLRERGRTVTAASGADAGVACRRFQLRASELDETPAGLPPMVWR